MKEDRANRIFRCIFLYVLQETSRGEWFIPIDAIECLEEPFVDHLVHPFLPTVPAFVVLFFNVWRWLATFSLFHSPLDL